MPQMHLVSDGLMLERLSHVVVVVFGYKRLAAFLLTLPDLNVKASMKNSG